MPSAPLTVWAFTSAWGMGYLVLRAIRFRGNGCEVASLSWLVGLTLQSWVTFVAGLFGIPFSKSWIVPFDVAVLSVGLAFLFYAAFKRKGLRRCADSAARLPQTTNGQANTTFFSAKLHGGSAYQSFGGGEHGTVIINASILFFILYIAMHMFINGQRLVWFSDALMSYDFRARAIAYEGIIRPVIYDWKEVRGPNFMYPPLTTIFHARYYLLGGDNPKLVYSMLLMAVAGVLWAGVYRLTSNRLAAMMAAVFIAFLPVTRKFSVLSVLDFPAMCYYGMGCVYLAVYARERKMHLLVISALGFAGAGFLRPEDPLFTAALVPVILWYFGWRDKGWRVLGILFLVYAVVVGSHEYFLRVLVGVRNEGSLNFSWAATLSPVRSLKAAWAFVRHFTSDRFMLLGPFTVALAWLGRKEADREGKLILGMLISFCVAWMTLVMIDNAGDWEVMRLNWSYFRIFIRISPLLVLYVLRHPLVIKGLSELFPMQAAKPLNSQRVPSP